MKIAVAGATGAVGQQMIMCLEERLPDAEVKALADELTDDDWNKAVEEIHKRLDTLPIHQKIMALEYPKTRNEWFSNFAK